MVGQRVHVLERGAPTHWKHTLGFVGGGIAGSWMEREAVHCCMLRVVPIRRGRRMVDALYTPHSLLPHFTLCTLHSTLHTLHCTLHTPHFTLCTPHIALHTLHFTLYTFHCTLYTLHFSPHTLHFSLYSPHSHTLHFALYTLHSTLFIAHPTLYKLHFTSHTEHSIPDTVHFTLYKPHFTVYTPHFTSFTPRSTLDTRQFTLPFSSPTTMILGVVLLRVGIRVSWASSCFLGGRIVWAGWMWQCWGRKRTLVARWWSTLRFRWSRVVLCEPRCVAVCEIGPKCRACWHLLGGAERCRRQRTCKHLVVVLEWWWITTVVVCGGRQQGKMKVML